MNGFSPQRSSPQGSGQRARGEAPTSGWRAAAERASEDPQLGLISLFAALIALIVLPFSIYRFAQGQIVVGIIDAVIVVAVQAWQTRHVPAGPAPDLAISVLKPEGTTRTTAYSYGSPLRFSAMRTRNEAEERK